MPRTRHSPETMICRLAFAASLSVLVSCASPPKVEYSEIAARYPEEPAPNRVVFDFQPACNDQGQCMVEEKRLNQAAQVITKLNDAVQHWVDAYNQRGGALTECSVSKAEKDAALQYQEDLSFRQQITNIGKQALIIAGCAILLR